MLSHLILTTAGTLLVVWATTQTIVSGLRAWGSRRRRERDLVRKKLEFWRTVEETARRARAAHAIPEWDGWRSFRIQAIVDECRAVKSFYLAPVDGRPLARFAPGQHLAVRLPIDPATSIVRCYSLSSSPREEFYRLTVKRIAKAHDSKLPGLGSSYLHDRAAVGDSLDVRAPSGTFLLEPRGTDPIVLIGAGIGVTPLVSMLDSMALARAQREVHVLLGFRNSLDHPFQEHLRNLATSHDNLKLHISYSQPLESDVLYRDFNHAGRMTIDRVQELLPSNNYRFYVCGPTTMMEQLVPALWGWGVPEENVFFEAFGPASVQRFGPAKTAGTRVAHEVRFARSDRTQIWDGTLKTLLEFGEAAGVVMPAGCRAGSCGECMIAIRSGAVETIKAPGVSVPPGHCLACISAPECDLVLEA